MAVGVAAIVAAAAREEDRAREAMVREMGKIAMVAIMDKVDIATAPPSLTHSPARHAPSMCALTANLTANRPSSMTQIRHPAAKRSSKSHQSAPARAFAEKRKSKMHVCTRY
ncbi:hypothetical protein NVIE_017800 [Nitrososphaera viennensis EN76]|uniref:Uncharacterized protein n=2 Tax=Nitrososphaera viennensis TaxID=1034015 RepID=A0A060HKN9_9ARCH|nr:hypothetical protein NVIE_017800 [Nitrososphaera viennensis EN76]